MKVCSSAERQSWTANNTVFELASNARTSLLMSLSYVIMRVLRVYEQLQGSIKRKGIILLVFQTNTFECSDQRLQVFWCDRHDATWQVVGFQPTAHFTVCKVHVRPHIVRHHRYRRLIQWHINGSRHTSYRENGWESEKERERQLKVTANCCCWFTVGDSWLSAVISSSCRVHFSTFGILSVIDTLVVRTH